jgi:hypothetical protein
MELPSQVVEKKGIVVTERMSILASNILSIYRQFEAKGTGVADQWVSLYVNDLSNYGEYARWYKYPPRDEVQAAFELGRCAFFNGLEKEAIESLLPQDEQI